MTPTCLVTLDLCSNLFTQLPSQLEYIPGLWNLFVNGNNISSLPDWVAGLHALRRFTFIGNPIIPCPEQKQLAANVQMSINLRELARQGGRVD